MKYYSPVEFHTSLSHGVRRRAGLFTGCGPFGDRPRCSYYAEDPAHLASHHLTRTGWLRGLRTCRLFDVELFQQVQ